MCLNDEWFQAIEIRKEGRDKEGVSISEAVSCLFAYYSTAYPVGSEMAKWIYRNWTIQQIYELPRTSRKILFEIIEEFRNYDNDRESKAKSPIADKNWIEWIVKALENLGGDAYLTDVYKEIERLRPDGLTHHWQATVRNVIDAHSSDSPNDDNSRKDYFYFLPGMEGGYCVLR